MWYWCWCATASLALQSSDDVAKDLLTQSASLDRQAAACGCHLHSRSCRTKGGAGAAPALAPQAPDGIVRTESFSAMGVSRQAATLYCNSGAGAQQAPRFAVNMQAGIVGKSALQGDLLEKRACCSTASQLPDPADRCSQSNKSACPGLHAGFDMKQVFHRWWTKLCQEASPLVAGRATVLAVLTLPGLSAAVAAD